MQAQVDLELQEHFHQKPAIVLTGAHHAREHITIQTVLYAALKLLHGAMHRDEESKQLLMQNKYYLIPSVNVDGSAYIDDQYYKTGRVEQKRKNMRPLMTAEERAKSNPDGANDVCNETLSGVDLNRNYGYQWGSGS